jgi:hypothetical protein
MAPDQSRLASRRPGAYFSFSMNLSTKRIAAVLLIALGTVLGGCSTDAPADSSIPWNRPADWEGQIPGMSGSGSQVH